MTIGARHARLIESAIDQQAPVGNTSAMSFADGLRSGRFVVALEITPPQQARPAVLLRRAGLLGTHPDTINVIQRPDRQSSLHATIFLLQAGIPAVWHLANRGCSQAEIIADLQRAAATGITQVLCVRGDYRVADHADTPTIRGAITLAQQLLPNALIGATLNQYAPDHHAVLRNLYGKVAAGAGYVQTQPVFDVTALRPLAEQLRDASPRTQIVPMVIPILTIAVAERIATRLRIPLPDQLLTRLTRGGAPAGWEHFDEILAGLAGSPWADGIAVMTAEIDASPEVGERLLAALISTGRMKPPTPPTGHNSPDSWTGVSPSTF